MKPILAATLAALLLLSGGSFAQEAKSPSTAELVLLQQAYQQAADLVAPSVVQVYVTRKPTEAPDGEDAYFVRPDAPTSGVIAGANGLVLTSAWNVADAESIRVTLADGRSFEAKRLGFDEVRDLALLSIQATDLPAARFHAADEVRIGQFALVIGRSPSIEHHTLTTGIVSAIGRFDGTAFQLEARTNYGSAGGAVVDIQGRVIGVVSRIVDQTNRGQNSGIGFATPSRLILQHMPDYEASKIFTVPKPPFLGIQADRSALDVQGVKISQVIVGTGAAAAGLAEGDVIVGFGDAKIERFEDLVREIKKLGIGSKVKITVLRGTVEKTVEATIGERPVGN